MRRTILFIIVLVIGIYSCKKETHADYPTVQINSPYNQETFNVFDNISIQAHITEGQTLVSVSVYVANSGNVPVLATVNVPVTGNTMDVNLLYAINDIHLGSGTYYVVVSASNGTNTTQTFRQIMIDAAPEKRTAIYAITRNSAGVNAWKIDSAFHSSVSFTLGGDYSSSDVSSYYQQLYITGYDSGAAIAYNVPTPSSAWSVAGISSPTPYFTNVYSYADAAYISYYAGYVKYYDHHGNTIQTYTTISGYYPANTFVWNGYLFSEQRTNSPIQTKLESFYQTGGALNQIANLPGYLVAMFGYDNSHLLVFGNSSAGLPYVLQYTINGGFYSPMVLPSAQILSVAQVDTNHYLLGFNNGTIYQFTFNPSNLIPYNTGVNASCIRYDNVDYEVLVSSGNKVLDYNFNSGALINSATLSDSVRDVRILYNK